ncbi:MAG: bifunctional hydroxymethylpyrimidine kinase/phosphomethylpyrimidine kinase [Thermomicrobiales bacterium]
MAGFATGWPAALTIAGSDSGGGAGIQADLKTFAALGAFGTSAITAITAQNTTEVRDALHLPPALVAGQIRAVMDDIAPAAAKTGMLANRTIIRAVVEAIDDYPDLSVVVDPVAFTSTGYPLLEPDAMGSLQSELIPRAVVITPNLREAAALSGLKIENGDDMRRAAEVLLERGARTVLVKGGHLTDSADDLFADGTSETWLRADHIDTYHTHGTGCSLSAAIAAGLARDLSLIDAIRQAKAFVNAGLRAGYVVGAGRSPINHFHAFQEEIERMYS